MIGFQPAVIANMHVIIQSPFTITDTLTLSVRLLNWMLNLMMSHVKTLNYWGGEVDESVSEI